MLNAVGFEADGISLYRHVAYRCSFPIFLKLIRGFRPTRSGLSVQFGCIWELFGFENGLVTWNRVYLDAGPTGYSANMIGAMLEVRL